MTVAYSLLKKHGLDFAAVLSLAVLVSIFILQKPALVGAVSPNILINEVQVAGVGINDDFIELYNPSDSDIDLADYRLVKRTEAGTTDSSVKAFEEGDMIAAGGFYLWANSGWDPGVTPDASTSATLAANNGVALRLGPEDTGEIVDSVGWGSATNAFVENTAAANPAAGQSIDRVNDVDTDNNSVDFALNESPTPQSSNAGGQASPTPTATPTASPTASPEPTESPTPTSSPTPEPTDSPTPSSTPTESPSPTSEPTESPEPTATATPEPTASPTPTPSTSLYKVLGVFNLRDRDLACVIQYQSIRIGFFRARFPMVVCLEI
jgi:hypothetical protein